MTGTPLTTETKLFFGDSKRSFKLTAPMIGELERTTGLGILALCKRIAARESKLFEMAEVIRLAMIGAGEQPETATALIKAYVDPAPINGTYYVALSIVEALLIGVDPLTGKEHA